MGTWREGLQAGLGASYQIRQELGGGGMSATFIAEEAALGRSVVLKALSPELSSGLNAERFRREIHLAARLQHAFIVPLLSAGVTDGHPWYTMPLVQGESLRARIAREGALTHGATARILRDVAEALAYAHSQGVVHRDIKPDNILLSGNHALVTDFGVAKALSASTAEGAMTGTGIAIGTPAYMAPEQAAGDHASDHRVDLYALGATGYEMVTGRHLFGQRSPGAMLVAHATETPEPIATVAPTVPRELASLIEQLLSKHPNDRPAHAQDVADALSVMVTRWTSGELPPTAAHVTLPRALTFWVVLAVSATTAAWLGVRWLPIPEWTFPAVVLTLLAGLPAVFLSVWLYRPAKPIVSLPSVSSHSTVGKLEAIARPHFTWRRTRRAGFIALGLVALLATTWAASRTLGIGPAATLLAKGVVAADDRVFVADFDSPPSDTGLGLVVSDLLRTELGRSESIRLLEADRRSATLIAMGRPASARVGSSDAREFSQRANAKVFVSGGVTQLGSGFLLRAALSEASTGNELATFRASATSADDIIRAVDRMGRELRDKLGASLREVRGAPALYWAVTPSLEAARMYSEGLRLAVQGDQVAGLRQLERAVEIDTSFAMAYRRMASFYGNIGNPERSSWAGERAFRHRAKLPPRVQRLVEGTFYFTAAGWDLAKSIAALEAVIEQFPSGTDIEVALNNLALNYRHSRDFDRSMEVYRKALHFDTTSTFAPFSILVAMWASGRLDEARQHTANNLTRWFPGHPFLLTMRAGLATAALRPDSAELILRAGLRDSVKWSATQRAVLDGFLTSVTRAQGQLAMAMRRPARLATLNPAVDTAGKFPLSMLYKAEILAWDRERPAEARRILDSVSAAHPPGSASALGYRWTEVAAAYAFAGDPVKARRLLTTYEQRASANVKTAQRQRLELARGWLAVAEKRYGDAITAFKAADVYECTICALAPLAMAYDLANQPDSAIAVFERYLSTNYWFREGQDQRYLAGTYKRLGELYDAKGNVPKAVEYYGRFVNLWKNADPELQPKVTQVRRRLAQLRAPG